MAKRIFDILASGFAILVLSPLLVPVMLLLRFSGEGYIFYRQGRLGRGGKPFQILKFATMLKDSPNMAGGDITSANDPRVLPMGHFLRKSKLNELPQLFNILRGDMSIIGPRPFTPRIYLMFPPDHWQRVGGLRPGLSGLSSVVFRDEERLMFNSQDRERDYTGAIVPYKIALEGWYAAHQSFWLDMKLILMTALAVVKPDLDVHCWLPGLPPPPPQLVALEAQMQALAHKTGDSG